MGSPRQRERERVGFLLLCPNSAHCCVTKDMAGPVPIVSLHVLASPLSDLIVSHLPRNFVPVCHLI